MFEGTEDTHEHRESDSEGLGQQPEAGHPAGEDVGAPEEGAGARKAATTRTGTRPGRTLGTTARGSGG